MSAMTAEGKLGIDKGFSVYGEASMVSWEGGKNFSLLGGKFFVGLNISLGGIGGGIKIGADESELFKFGGSFGIGASIFVGTGSYGQ
jgi:hypothetical protein